MIAKHTRCPIPLVIRKNANQIHNEIPLQTENGLIQMTDNAEGLTRW